MMRANPEYDAYQNVIFRAWKQQLHKNASNSFGSATFSVQSRLHTSSFDSSLRYSIEENSAA
jgi:hypothetical protein